MTFFGTSFSFLARAVETELDFWWSYPLYLYQWFSLHQRAPFNTPLTHLPNQDLDMYFPPSSSSPVSSWPDQRLAVYVDCKTVRIFAYSSTREQSNKRSGMRLKTESETGERRLKFFFSHTSHALRVCDAARALRARKTLTPCFTDFFTDFEKKTDCFAVYRLWGSSLWTVQHQLKFKTMIIRGPCSTCQEVQIG